MDVHSNSCKYCSKTNSHAQVAADNTDFNLDNLDGKNLVHITGLVLYQDKPENIEPVNNIPMRRK